MKYLYLIMKTKIKVVGYIRSAQKENDEEINKKISCLKEVFNKHEKDWDVIDILVDNGYSGRSDDRPGLKKIMSGEMDYSILVTLGYHMIARDVLLYRKVYQLLNSSGKSLYIM